MSLFQKAWKDLDYNVHDELIWLSQARKDATQIVANLPRQPVNSRLIASDYLEDNLDHLDILINGYLLFSYEDTDLAFHYGAMHRECIHHQSVARYILESHNMKKFF
ncbi:hypothetical protein MLD38_028870 [Melastoma candidum]|uniref:Uncharacterized protein n=1 Tax=Melastoma candidum TaxID=119954 RepID=A0ACB9N222_9MYRT|nr:hypothetical protein MLD38_028870 [Melastoma candidum]